MQSHAPPPLPTVQHNKNIIVPTVPTFPSLERGMYVCDRRFARLEIPLHSLAIYIIYRTDNEKPLLNWDPGVHYGYRTEYLDINLH